MKSHFRGLQSASDGGWVDLISSKQGEDFITNGDFILALFSKTKLKREIALTVISLLYILWLIFFHPLSESLSFNTASSKMMSSSFSSVSSIFFLSVLA